MDYDLEKVNAERRKKGQPPLTPEKARALTSDHPPGYDTTGFLIGYMLGIPTGSPESVVGTLLHGSSEPLSTAPAADPTPAYELSPPSVASSPADTPADTSASPDVSAPDTSSAPSVDSSSSSSSGE